MCKKKKMGASVQLVGKKVKMMAEGVQAVTDAEGGSGDEQAEGRREMNEHSLCRCTTHVDLVHRTRLNAKSHERDCARETRDGRSGRETCSRDKNEP